jgi:hypothetical protein
VTCSKSAWPINFDQTLDYSPEARVRYVGYITNSAGCCIALALVMLCNDWDTEKMKCFLDIW